MVQIKKITSKHGPEHGIQKQIISFLREREWFVRATHGNQYQSGFPDLFAAKRRYGMRWIEIKYGEQYKFTDAQLDTFPKFSAAGVGIWILTSEREYMSLFSSPNWASYLPVCRVHTRNRKKIAKEKVEKRIAGSGPERDIQTAIINALELDGWFVLETYGSLYQSGFPDLYACKRGHGQRWIEVKNPQGYKFTPEQLETFPRMDCEGVPIWILTSDNLSPIHGPPNWRTYLK